VDERVLREQTEQFGLGATGQRPDGPAIVPEDEGELKVAMSIIKERIVVNFGKDVSFIAMTAEQALDMARLLVQWSVKLDVAMGTYETQSGTDVPSATEKR